MKYGMDELRAAMLKASAEVLADLRSPRVLDTDDGATSTDCGPAARLAHLIIIAALENQMSVATVEALRTRTVVHFGTSRRGSNTVSLPRHAGPTVAARVLNMMDWIHNSDLQTNGTLRVRWRRVPYDIDACIQPMRFGMKVTLSGFNISEQVADYCSRSGALANAQRANPDLASNLQLGSAVAYRGRD